MDPFTGSGEKIIRKKEKETMKLEPDREIIGILKKIYSRNGKMLLTFIVKKKVEIPDDLELKEALKQYIGSKIGVLHVDDRFFVRKIER